MNHYKQATKQEGATIKHVYTKPNAKNAVKRKKKHRLSESGVNMI
jgi:hypothetical protein